MESKIIRGLDMRKNLKLVFVLIICLGMLVPACALAERVDLKGEKITMSILGIAGWFPSGLGWKCHPHLPNIPRKNTVTM
jgi:hypothetical protein